MPESVSRYRVVQHTREDHVHQEESIWYTIQYRWRPWWKLFMVHWSTLQYEGGLPGYYHNMTFRCKSEAINEADRLASNAPSVTISSEIIAEV
jgi:hypothetical protein